MPMPRLALGTVQPAADPTPLLWALVGCLKEADHQVQIFHERACFAGDRAETQLCGQTPRYLDSWLMSPDLCRQSFLHGASGSDISLIAGKYASARPDSAAAGGTLEELAVWLDLPQVAVVDVSQLGPCKLPPRPLGAAGLLLDRVADEEVFYWQVVLESLWGVPVLGSLPELPEARRLVHSTSGAVSPCEVCHALGYQLSRRLRWPQLLSLASRYEFPAVESKLFVPGNQLRGVTIAVAYDEAINGYFPDVLDLLELQAATVVDFSPLRDEALPAGTDVVYLGCGHPERYAEKLAGNHCMTLALRNHVRQGRRCYAEGGGMAYLCQTLRLPSGQYLPMAGVLPAVAIHSPAEQSPRPAQLTLARDHWLGPAGFQLSGYLDPAWHFEAAGPLDRYVAESGSQWYLAARGQAVGSRLQVNFAALPDFVRQFSARAETASRSSV